MIPGYMGWQPPTPDPKKLADLVTLDDIPSPTPIITGVNGKEVLMVIPVHGLGVITLRSTESDAETGRLKFEGVGIFTDAEIRRPILSERDLKREG